MGKPLVELINTNDDCLKGIFTDQFKDAAHWAAYLDEQFGRGSAPVTSLLASASMKVESFQALYVACWIYTPVEKGSYMIELTTTQQKNSVMQGSKKLKGRWSSHGHENDPRSAGANWRFLQGYEELLVQIEGNEAKPDYKSPMALFLKCEGHPAISVAHMQSFFHKLVTGKGKTASAALKDLAEYGKVEGLEPRRAENYSNKYKKVLKALNLSGKVQTAYDVAMAMWERLNPPNVPQQSLAAVARKLGIKSSDISKFTPSELAKFLRDELLPRIDGLQDTDPLKKAVQGARKDFDLIIQSLGRDKSGGTRRLFAEVKVTPADLDRKLKEFRRALKPS